MILANISAWFTFFFIIAVSSWASVSIVARGPWSDDARKNRLPLFFGLSVAPFLVGLMSIFSLGILPGASHGTHIFVVIIPFVALVAASLFKKEKYQPPATAANSSLISTQEIAFLVLLFCGICTVIFHSFFLPLTQNDSLEYLTVGKILFELRELAAYPALAPEKTSSGFYGPWTHPPLYVSLIYLTNAIQGYADAPGLMRLIAPWFSLVTLGLIYSLGQFIHSRLGGLIAAVVTLYTPLFFLGTESALIDPLPITGLLIAITALLGLRVTHYIYPVCVGLSIGLGMWSHSQTILFPLIVLPALFLRQASSAGLRIGVRVTAIAVASCLALTLWPYLRNYFIFGSPISDNPIVFALPELNWPEYFQVARGYFFLGDKIQYGLFKGWFMIESYSWTFWLMSAGAIYSLASKVKRKKQFWNLKSLIQSKIFLIVSLLLIYMLGVGTSIVFNIDLMIRNERYLLIMLPIVSIIAGVTIAPAIMSMKPPIKHLVLVGFVIAFTMQLFVLSRYRWKSLGLETTDIFKSLDEKLDDWSQVKAMRFLRDQTAPESLVLSLLPADMYYSNRTMLSYLDPRLVPFYKAKNVDEGIKILKDLGISYVHVPNYAIPPLYNSLITSIINNRKMTTLVFSESGFQIYKIKSVSNLPNILESEVGFANNEWTDQKALTLLGRKGIFRFNISKKQIHFAEVNQSSRELYGDDGIVQRFWSPVLLISEDLPTEISALVELSGQGLVKFYFECIDKESSLNNSYVVGEALLNSNQTTKFERRILTQQKKNNCKFGIEKKLSQKLVISKLKMTQLHMVK